MKKLFVLIFTFIISVSSFATSKVNTLIPYIYIDTITILPPIGAVYDRNGTSTIQNKRLSKEFTTKLKKILPSTTTRTISIIDNDSVYRNISIEYLVRSVEKIRDIPNETFAMIGIGEDFEKLLNDQKGRYFAIIFYEGFINENFETEIITSTALGLIGGALTGGLFVGFTIPKTPFLNVSVIIIDKQSKKFVMYRDKQRDSSPIEEDTIKKIFLKIFEALDYDVDDVRWDY